MVSRYYLQMYILCMLIDFSNLLNSVERPVDVHIDVYKGRRLNVRFRRRLLNVDVIWTYIERSIEVQINIRRV